MNENYQSKHNIDYILNSANSSSSSHNADDESTLWSEDSQERLYYVKVMEALKKNQHISAHSAFSPKITSTIKKELKRNSTSPLSSEQDENNPNGLEIKRIKKEPKMEDDVKQQNQANTPKVPSKLKKNKKNKAFEQINNDTENSPQTKEINEKVKIV